jgi:hypothetical protein
MYPNFQTFVGNHDTVSYPHIKDYSSAADIYIATWPIIRGKMISISSPFALARPGTPLTAFADYHCTILQATGVFIDTSS